jgi:hypothetical protein
VHRGIISAVRSAAFICDRKPYIILDGRWCHTTVLKIHAPTEDKIDMKDTSYKDLESVFNEFPKCQMKILLEKFCVKAGREDILNPVTRN